MTDEAADFHEWATKLPPVERQIATHLHGQHERLLAIAHSPPRDASERVLTTIAKVNEKPTASRLEALGRELLRQRDEDDSAALMLILNQ